MRHLLFYFLLIISVHSTYATDYNHIIVPVKYHELENDTVKHEVQAIMDGNTKGYFHEFKTRGKGNWTSHSHRGWEFSILFSDSSVCGQKQCNINCPQGQPILRSIRCYHMKSMVQFTSQSLSHLNQEILDELTGPNITSTSRAYISKDYRRNYCCLSFMNGGKKLEYIFIRTWPYWIQCVVHKN